MIDPTETGITSPSCASTRPSTEVVSEELTKHSIVSLSRESEKLKMEGRRRLQIDLELYTVLF
jgi:hypothetical protein